MIKKILLFIVSLIGLVLVLAIFLPSSYKVERTTTINAKQKTIFNNVADLNNYLKWNPWSKMDPEAKNTISENSKGVGASWSWDGPTVGKGSLSIVKLEEFKSIETKIIFTEPRQDEGSGYWTFEKTDNGTKVTWAMKGELAYPIGKIMGLFMDNMLGGDFEKGLANLKEVCEE